MQPSAILGKLVYCKLLLKSKKYFYFKMLNIFKEYLLVKCSFVPKVTFCENIFIQNFRLKFPRLSPLYGFMIRSRHHVDKRIKMEIEGHIK